MYVPTYSTFPKANANSQIPVKFGQSPESEEKKSRSTRAKRPEAAPPQGKVEVQDPLIIEAFNLKKPTRRGTQGHEPAKGQAPKGAESSNQNLDFSGWVHQKIERFVPETWQPTLIKAAEKAKEESERAANEKGNFLIGTVLPMFTALFGFPSLAVMLAKCNDFFGHPIIRGPIGVVADDIKDHVKKKAKEKFLGTGPVATLNEPQSLRKTSSQKISVEKNPIKKTRPRKS
ncbi:MAG TPA: hypothetical protein V6C52_14050 [Coleofasciculaceae cyanobacterium]|jgi:hypothetical protein